MVFLSSYFGIQEDDFVKLFQVSIQFGAILAVVSLYWKKFSISTKMLRYFYIKLILCCHLKEAWRTKNAAQRHRPNFLVPRYGE
jgi:hypothetical protein